MPPTSSTLVVVLRPPSPKLGNFSHAFGEYLQDVSGTAPKLDVSELLELMEGAGKISFDVNFSSLEEDEQLHIATGTDGTSEAIDKNNGNISETSTIRAAIRIPDIATPRKPSPRLVKAAKGLTSGSIKEFKPSPLQDVTGDDDPTQKGPRVSASNFPGHIVPSSSPETSDEVPHRPSVFDQTPWRPSTDATPVTSPDVFNFSQLIELTPSKSGNATVQAGSHFLSTTTAAFDYATVGVSGFQAVNFHASSSTMQSNMHFTPNVASTSVQCVSGASGYSGATGSDVVFNKVTSANGTFRYHRFPVQPFPGVDLYAVEATQSRVDRVIPHYMCTREEKQRVLEFKMQKLTTVDRNTATKTPHLTGNYHVFVDLSNITIGFYDCLRRSHNISTHRRMKAPKFSFENLALTLERGRNVTKRVVAGSVEAAYQRKWTTYMQEGQELGYEMSILQRVTKAVAPTPRNQRLSASLEPEWTASDANSSTDEAFLTQLLKQGEQGVDEVLHLKMAQSALDEGPGTAILATGDAAEAEFSDGFKKNVERLLTRGWNVEVMGWSATISRAWTEPEFIAQYGKQIRIIELDPFVEEIFGAWFGAHGY